MSGTTGIRELVHLVYWVFSNSVINKANLRSDSTVRIGKASFLNIHGRTIPIFGGAARGTGAPPGSVPKFGRPERRSEPLKGKRACKPPEKELPPPSIDICNIRRIISVLRVFWKE
ncbi:hypothetical protein EVAR_94530_1 [Eumeta japonica]|uniref:Uncharacterized protein n=1 Tax=Eumeta variegata TaxID=151549 RepID=A0A4C1UW56_EUMVA|nr:hypothetical protein EVAR_94530_1 [Eumeta japonica]